MNRHILPTAMLGILGGGQLGRMFSMSALSMGYRVTVLDPDIESPAGALADVHLCAAYDDLDALQQLADTCAAVTTEFENVPAESMAFLEQHIRISPSSNSVAIAQDRIREKRFISSAGLEVVPYLAIENLVDFDQDLTGHLPGILKIARLGYDGKGQVRVCSREEAQNAFLDMGCNPCVLERKLELQTEISVIVTRTGVGQSVCFPVAENHHAGGILDISIVPARVDTEVTAHARQMALQLAESLDYIGGGRVFRAGRWRIAD